MPIELTKDETDEIIPSLRRFFREEFEEELSEMRARFLLDYFQKEIAPFAYNRGVNDAERYFRAKADDLGGVCFEQPLTWWTRRKR